MNKILTFAVALILSIAPAQATPQTDLLRLHLETIRAAVLVEFAVLATELDAMDRTEDTKKTLKETELLFNDFAGKAQATLDSDSILIKALGGSSEPTDAEIEKALILEPNEQRN